MAPLPRNPEMLSLITYARCRMPHDFALELRNLLHAYVGTYLQAQYLCAALIEFEFLQNHYNQLISNEFAFMLGASAQIQDWKKNIRQCISGDCKGEECCVYTPTRTVQTPQKQEGSRKRRRRHEPIPFAAHQMQKSKTEHTTTTPPHS